MSKITKEEVYKAAMELDATGIKPSVVKIREKIGKGSFSTITKFLSEWEPQGAASDIPPVPESLEALLPSIWGVCFDHAQAHFEAELLKKDMQIETLTSENEYLQKAFDEADASLDALSDTAHGMKIENIALKEQVKDLTGYIRGLKDSAAKPKDATKPKKKEPQTGEEKHAAPGPA